MKTIATLVWVAVLVLSGCGGHDVSHGDHASSNEPAAEPAAEPKDVTVQLQAKSESSVTGNASFLEQDGAILLHIEIGNAPPGDHAFHIHEIGDCSAEDGTSAGGHWNPTAHAHGRWEETEFHLGDVGNITIGEDGSGTFHMTSEHWSIGTGEANDILGKAVILHAGKDDFTTQPTGAAGGRIACGVIE